MSSFWEAFPQQRLLVDVSLWSANFTCFRDEIARVDPYADLYHIDVSDGHFVPGLLFFADLVEGLRPLTSKPFHVHLMTANPLLHITDFARAGANIITVHAENGPLAPAALSQIRREGLAAGLALGLDVNPASILPYLELIDIIVMMGTPMGIKGVEPSRHAFTRMQQVRRVVNEAGFRGLIRISADGGIREHTVPDLRANGADMITAGSLAFKTRDLEQTFGWLRSLPGYKDPA